MIWGDLEDSKESEMTSKTRVFKRYVQASGSSVTGSESSLAGEVINVRTIPIPGWRKITEGNSEDSDTPT